MSEVPAPWTPAKLMVRVEGAVGRMGRYFKTSPDSIACEFGFKTEAERMRIRSAVRVLLEEHGFSSHGLALYRNGSCQTMLQEVRSGVDFFITEIQHDRVIRCALVQSIERQEVPVGTNAEGRGQE